MKQIIAFLCVGAASLVGFAQQTLEFNQVKLVRSTETVPAGYVWKVETPALSLKNSIRTSPFFRVDNDTVYMGYDSYKTTDLENVVSIVLQVKGSRCGNTTLTGTGINIIGSSGLNTIDNNLSTGGFTPNSNYTTVATFTPPFPGNNIITDWNIYLNYTHSGSSNQGYSLTYRIVFLKGNGESLVYFHTFSPNGTSCLNYGSQSNTQSQSNQTVPNQIVTRPQIATQFPMWLPAGTTLTPLGNINYFSVIEFKVN